MARNLERVVLGPQDAHKLSEHRTANSRDVRSSRNQLSSKKAAPFQRPLVAELRRLRIKRLNDCLRFEPTVSS